MKKIGSHGHHSFFTFEHEGKEHRIDVKQMTQEDLEAEGITTDMLKDMVEELTKPSPGPGPSMIWVEGVWYEKGPDGKWREQEWIEEEEETDGGNGPGGETEETPIHRTELDQRGGHASNSP